MSAPPDPLSFGRISEKINSRRVRTRFRIVFTVVNLFCVSCKQPCRDLQLRSENFLIHCHIDEEWGASSNVSRPVVISFLPIRDHFVITSGVFIEIIIALSLNGFISARIVSFCTLWVGARWRKKRDRISPPYSPLSHLPRRGRFYIA